MTQRTLVLGGTRSGKSRYAEQLLDAAAPATYVATARRDPDDPEWQARIAAHAASRPAAWRTVETVRAEDLTTMCATATDAGPPLLVEDVGTWLTGTLDETGAWDGDPEAARTLYHALADAVRACRARLVLVSSEVGMTVVPPTRSGRLFSDELGLLNQRLAAACDEALLIVAGVPVRLK